MAKKKKVSNFEINFQNHIKSKANIVSYEILNQKGHIYWILNKPNHEILGRNQCQVWVQKI